MLKNSFPRFLSISFIFIAVLSCFYFKNVPLMRNSIFLSEMWCHGENKQQYSYRLVHTKLWSFSDFFRDFYLHQFIEFVESFAKCFWGSNLHQLSKTAILSWLLFYCFWTVGSLYDLQWTAPPYLVKVDKGEKGPLCTPLYQDTDYYLSFLCFIVLGYSSFVEGAM